MALNNNINAGSTTNQVFVYGASGTTATNMSAVGDMVLLSSQVASNSTSIDFTSVMSSTYKSYKLIIISAIAATTTSNMTMIFSTDNGSNWDTTSGSYAFYNSVNKHATTSTDTSLGNASTTNIELSNSNDATNIMSFLVDIANPNVANAIFTKVLGSYYNTVGSAYVTVSGGGIYTPAQDVDAIRIIMSSGNITSGIFKLYGMA